MLTRGRGLFFCRWQNAEENGGRNPVNLWQFDTGIAEDILLVTAFPAVERKYPDDLGFATEIADVWKLRRMGSGLSALT